MTGRTRDSGDLDFVIGKLEGEFEFLANHLAPGGSRTGAVYQPRNPLRDDRNPGSLVIYVAGPHKGKWREYSPALPGQGGAYDFVAYILGSGDIAKGRKLAWRYLADRYGLKSASPADKAAWRERRKVETVKKSKAAEEQSAKRRGIAQKLYINAHPAPNTPVQAYLETARGIAFDVLGRWPNAIRYAPELAHPEDGVYGPAMIAAVTQWRAEGKSRFLAAHRTFLEQDAAGRWRKRGDVDADIRESKYALGHYAGGAVNVWRGKSGKPLAEAPDDDVVVITEGLEDALTVAYAYQAAAPRAPQGAIQYAGPRVLCAISIANLANVALPPQIRDVRLAVDNDGDNPQAARQIERAIEAYDGQGRAVRLIRAPGGAKDLNAALLSDRGAPEGLRP